MGYREFYAYSGLVGILAQTDSSTKVRVGVHEVCPETLQIKKWITITGNPQKVINCMDSNHMPDNIENDYKRKLFELDII